MKEPVAIKVGQVWNDRDKRMLSGNRCAVVTALATPEHPKVLLEQCQRDGARLTGCRAIIKVSENGLRTRWKLIGEAP